MSTLASEEVKNNQILQLFDKFSKDSSKWVKVATFQYFGPFIFSFDQMNKTHNLLDYFLKIGHNEKDGKQLMMQ